MTLSGPRTCVRCLEEHSGSSDVAVFVALCITPDTFSPDASTTTASLNAWDRNRIESMMMPMDLRDNDLKPVGNGN